MRNYAAVAALAALLATAPLAVHAGTTAETGHDGHHATTGDAADTAMSEGEVRKVNPDTQKITLRHGELKNLGMPPMTMVFRVADPRMLEQVKAGDKVRFVADKVDGQFTIMRIEMR